MKPFHTQKDDKYIQYWFKINVDEYMLYPERQSSKKTNERVFGITVPKIIKSNYKYPFLLNLDFNIDGISQGWYAKKKLKDKSQSTEYKGYGGLIEKNSDTNYLYSGANIVGFRYLQNFYRDIIDKDIIIIHTSMVGPDAYYYADCEGRSNDYIKDYNNLCWYPNNPDLNYLQRLFDVLYNSKLYNELNIDIDYDKMALFGYSVGAQAASRYINEFPFLRTVSNHKFPDIKSAVLLAGGSYQCYNDALYNGELFKNCTQEKQNNNGCCPENFTEKNYMDGKLSWKNHPPVMCVQQLNDFYADPKASVYYVNELKKHNVPTIRLTSYGYQHGFANNDQSTQAETFIYDYLTDKNYFQKSNQSNQINKGKQSDKDKQNNINSFIIVVYILLIIISAYIVYMTKSHQSYIVLCSLCVLLFIDIIKVNSKTNSKIIETFESEENTKNEIPDNVIEEINEFRERRKEKFDSLIIDKIEIDRKYKLKKEKEKEKKKSKKNKLKKKN